MRQLLGVLTLATMLTTAVVAVRASGATDLGLPPLVPMNGAAVLAPADEPAEQALPPYRVQHEENRESGPVTGSDQ